MKEFLRKGDKLFQKIPLPKEFFNTSPKSLNSQDFITWRYFADSYFFQGLIRNKLTSNSNNNSIIEKFNISIEEFNKSYTLIPYSFLYRHYIELILKLIFLIDSKKNDTVDFDHIITTIKTHELNDFWGSVKKIISKMEPEISNEQIKRLECIINDFIYIDKQSTRFRYPFDKFGNFVFNVKNHFGFLPAQSVKTMKRVKKLFDYILDIMFSDIE